MALTKIQTAAIADDAITNATIADDAINQPQIADNAVALAHMQDDSVGVTELSATGTASSSTFLRGDNSWATPTDTNTVYTHPNHSGEVTSTADGAQVIADDVVDEANLKVDNSPTNDYVLTAKSSAAGGLTWAAASGGAALTGSTNNTITTVTGANAIQGEANLTFDGSALVESAGAASVTIKSTNANTAGQLHFDGDAVTTADYWLGNINGKWNGNDVAAIRLEAGDDTTNKDDGRITFNVSASGSSPAEAMRIEPNKEVKISGKVHITDDLADGQLVVGTSTSDTATKYGTFNVPHKTNSEEPVLVIGGESTASDSQNVYIGGGFSTQNACKQILFYTATDTTTVTGTERVKITTTGNVNIANGNLAFSTAGKGIDFSATSGAGSGELFDDYEEGTWTPNLYHQGANNNAGFYTKIGRMVYAHFKLTAISAAGNTNHQRVTGLPFTIKDSNPCGSAARGYQTYNSQGGPLYSLSSNSTEVYLYTNTGSAIEAAGLGTTTLTGTFIYMTDS